MTATQGGGGIFIDDGYLEVLNGSEIRGNVVNQGSSSGGGIFLASGEVTINNSAITNNRARRAGGGIEAIDGKAKCQDRPPAPACWPSPRPAHRSR